METNRTHQILMLNFCSIHLHILHLRWPVWEASSSDRRSWQAVQWPRLQGLTPVLPGAQTSVSRRRLFIVGDAKIISAPPNGTEKLVAFGQVTKTG